MCELEMSSRIINYYLPKYKDKTITKELVDEFSSKIYPFYLTFVSETEIKKYKKNCLEICVITKGNVENNNLIIQHIFY